MLASTRARPAIEIWTHGVFGRHDVYRMGCLPLLQSEAQIDNHRRIWSGLRRVNC